MNPFVKENPLLVSILLFLLIFVVIQIGKPDFLYNKDGSIRHFGIGYLKKTIFPIWIMTIVLSILSYTFVRFYLITF